MIGQWIGRYEGTVDGKLMNNIDQVEQHFEGVAYVMPDDKNIPSSVAYLSTDDTGLEHESTAYINPVDARSGFQSKWAHNRGLVFCPSAQGSLAKGKT